MLTVHCTLQGKGGVGKSFASSLLAQYHLAKDRPVLCIDTDPVNATFATYEAFNVEHLRLMREEIFDYDAFDQLLLRVIEADCDVVVDNGAASFGVILAALVDNDAPTLLANTGKALLIHSVIAGADNLADTLHGFNETASRMPEPTPFIVWLNEYFGVIEHEGKGFEQMKAYERHVGRIQGLVHMRKQKPNFEHDLHLMLQKRLTFDQTRTTAAFDLLKKSRLQRIKTDYFNQLGVVLGPETSAYEGSLEESADVGA